MSSENKRVNFFISIDTVKAFIEKYVVDQSVLREQIYFDCAFTADVIEGPHRLFYRGGTDQIELEIDSRMGIYQVEEQESRRKAKAILNADGEVNAQASEDYHGLVQLYLAFCTHFSSYLREHGVFEQYHDLDPEKQGILVEMNDKGVEPRLVSGDERPDLVCETITGETKLMRPYDSDFRKRTLLGLLPLEKKEAAAEAGDTKMMRHLFEYYMGNDENPHKEINSMMRIMKTIAAAAGKETELPDVEEEENTRDPAKAFYWLKKLAESGDADADIMDSLSTFYLKAFGTERDFKKAAEWRKKAVENGLEEDGDLGQVLLTAAESKEKAEAGDAEAQAQYARILALIAQYHPELGDDEDEKEAFRWAQKAASGANPEGLTALAEFYQNGTGTAKDETKAFRLIERAAKNGHAPSQARLGQMYFQGEGTKENPAEAFAWCKKAAEAGDVTGMSNLAACYLAGKGTEKNVEKAKKWLGEAAELGDESAKKLLLQLLIEAASAKRKPRTVEEAVKAAEEGSVEAMMMLANYYINRPGGREDLYEAHKWAKMAAERGDEEAKKTCERLEASFNGETISFEEAKSGAESGDLGAQKILADYYATGFKTERDLVKALYWMKKAAASGDPRFAEHAQGFVDSFSDIAEIVAKAETGDPHAQAQLAEKYLGISQNYPDYDQEKGYRDTLEMAGKAEAGGDPLGMFVLGACYENGYGTAVDLDKAFALYKKSADLGNPRGELSLSQAYLMGRGTDYDVDAAIDWFHKAEDHGNPEAEKVRELYPQLMLMMAMDMLGSGEKSGRPDPELGAKYMQQAAEFGNAAAQHYLGIMLVNGAKIERDFEKGIEWIRKASENGNKQAADSLNKYDRPEAYNAAAKMEIAKKEKADKEKVFRLVKHAAEAGLAAAQDNLGFLYMNGYGVQPDYEVGMEWLQKAAEQGFENAKKNIQRFQSANGLVQAALAQLSYTANKGLTDFSKAHQLLRRAAEAGSAEACNTLGVLYADPEKPAEKFGRIGDQDRAQARAWFEKALALNPELEQAKNNMKKLEDLEEAEKTGRAPNAELKWAIALKPQRPAAGNAQPTPKPEPAKSAEPPAPRPEAEKPAEPAKQPEPAAKPESALDKALRERREYREKGLCQYCGGDFKKGLFGTKCTRCGKKKDY